MIKDIINENENVTLNNKELTVLKEVLPFCFKKDGTFDIERLKEFLNTKVDITNEGHELKFLGKKYARLLTSIETTTVVVPDNQHNSKEENRDSQNIYISGDNIDAIKHLLKSYAGRLKCIYIDPPYNTGSDGFVYNDSFSFTSLDLQEKLSISEEHAQRILDITKRGSASHSAWLMFMYPRLILARDLLDDDGCILISIDKNEHANLKIICDDIFGEENYIESIIWEKKTGAKGVPPQNMMVNVHEYVVAFQRKEGFRFAGEERDESGFKNPDNDPRGPWRESNIKSTTKSPDEAFTITDPNTGKEYTNTWAFSRESLERMIEEGRILWKANLPKQKEYLHEMTNETKALKSSWGVFDPQSTTQYLKDIMPEVHFDNPKPISFMKYLISVSSAQDDIILDFFGGSATTAHAVMELNVENPESNRKYIIVQWPELVKDKGLQKNPTFNTIDKIGYERIIRTAEILKEKETSKGVDLGFKRFFLKEPRVETIDKIEKFKPEDNGLLITNGILEEFGIDTVLQTWLVRDGYGFTQLPEEIDFSGYKGYHIDKHLYLIEPGLSEEAIASITDKYVMDGDFNPESIVLFGYSFTWTEIESLKTNLGRLREDEKNLKVNYDVRY